MTALPPEVRAELLEAVLAEKFPKMALGAIAARFSVTMATMQPVLQQAGYPDPAKMRKAVTALRAEVAAAEVDRAASYDAPSPSLATVPGPIAVRAGDDPRSPDPEGGRLLVVRVDQLRADPANLRPPLNPDDPGIVELAETIAEAGLLQPIVARRHGDHLVVVMGHRRLAAVRRLKHRTVDCIVRGPMSEDEVLAAMLIENGHRADLDPISEARGLRRLQVLMGDEEGPCTEAELARRVGRSGVFVRSRILLLSLDAATQDRVRRGELGVGAAGSAAASATGRTGTPGVDRNWHLGPTHDLAGRVRRACSSAGHATGRKVGGEGCGECWEKVIRADERQRFVDHGHATGKCPVCDGPVDQATPLVPTFSGAGA